MSRRDPCIGVTPVRGGAWRTRGMRRPPLLAHAGPRPVKGVGDSVGARPTPVTGSFQPAAVEVVGEATNRREPSMSKGWGDRQLSEPAGRNASERRAGPKNASCGSRPSARKGKAAAPGRDERSTPRESHRGKDDGTRQGNRQRNTGDPPRWSVWTTNRQPARDPAGPRRKSERPIVLSTQGNACRGKGPHFQRSVRQVDEREIGDEPATSGESRETSGGTTHQSEGGAGLRSRSRLSRIKLPS